MANDLSVLIPKVFSAMNEVLENEFQFIADTEKNFAAAAGKIGQSVTIGEATSSMTATDVAPGQYPVAPVDRTPLARTLTIDKWKKSEPFQMTSKEGMEIYSKDELLKNVVQEAARSVLYQMNSDLWACYKDVYGYAGTAGTNPFATNVNPVSDVRNTLNQQLVPDVNRKLLLGYAEETSALQLDDLKKMLNAGDSQALRRGSVGNLYGIGIFRDGQRVSHTAGTITTGLINKTATAIALGARTCTGTTAASTGACALKQGDIMVFAGDTQTYVLTADATQAAAATDVTLAFLPGKKVAATGGEAITVKATHKVNLAYDNMAFGAVIRLPGADLEGMSQGQHFPFVHPKTGVVLMLSHYGVYHAEQWEISALYGVKCIDPNRAARLAG